MRDIPGGTWVTSYVATAPVVLSSSGQDHSSDYILQLKWQDQSVELDGSSCCLGLGRIIQDGTFPFILAPEKYSNILKSRVNVKWFVRDNINDIWFKSTRYINAGEELFTVYTEDNSYWTRQFSGEAMGGLKNALMSASSDGIHDAEEIIKNFHL